MSVILQPQVAFPLVRQISNHLDSTTYYVRAVVRNAQGTTIDTVNLDSQGDQRYQTSWQVPADPSGMGAYISIVTSVYTDSGYTTKSPDYGDEENTYLIFDRVLPAMRGGGGLDSRTLRRVIQEELGKLPKPEPVEFPEIPEPEMRWNDILAAIGEMRDALDRVPTKETDLSPVVSRINDLAQMITDKPVTPETDLTPILSRLEDDKEESDLGREDLKQLLESVENNLIKAIPAEIDKAIKNTRFVSQFNTFAAPNQQIEQEKKDVFDLSKLSI